MRNMLFLSHANPEDNEFTLWLALQLAREGYPVWCDLTKLLGGEDFWRDIEQAIREKTIKFLFVLSKTSNTKLGPLQELQVAQNIMRDHNLHDFIIPLLIDDLPYRQINIQLARINAIPFNQSWAKGLKALLNKLEQDNIPKSVKFTPSAVASWWRTQFSADEGLLNQPEENLSDWFPIRALPQNIYFHTLQKLEAGKLEVQDDPPYPAFQHNQYLVSFAQSEDFVGKLGDFISLDNAHSFSIQDFLAGNIDPNFADRKQARDFVSHLLRVAWQKMIEGRNLLAYELANHARCFYFQRGFATKDRISFKGIDGTRTYRNMVGYSKVKKRFWHFGIHAKPRLYSEAYIIKPHVLFSDDGRTIWDNKKRLHKARRSQCRNWWNSDWRDRILAVMTWLSNEEGQIEIALGSDVTIQVLTYPLMFTSPVSYIEPGTNESLRIDDQNEESEEVEEIEERDED